MPVCGRRSAGLRAVIRAACAFPATGAPTAGKQNPCKRGDFYFCSVRKRQSAALARQAQGGFSGGADNFFTSGVYFFTDIDKKPRI